jgi:tetratricopeptide (TPR) repeat protein
MCHVRSTTWWLLLTAMLLMVGMATPAAAGNADGSAACDPTAAPELRIRGCSDLIRSGDVVGNALADAYITRGDAYAETSDHAGAIADYDAAIGLGEERAARVGADGDDRDARRDLANAYYKRGSFHVWRNADFARGIADLDQAIRLDPDLVDAYKARGWAYQASGDYDRANIDYEEAVQRYVDDCPLSMKALHPS